MKKHLLTVVLVSLIAGVLFLACSKSNNSNSNTTTTNNNSVGISNFNYTPNSLTITKGTTVVWTNNDSAPHTVTADDNSFTSGTLNKGDTYSHTFNAAGTVNYHCTFHPIMKASVTTQ